MKIRIPAFTVEISRVDWAAAWSLDLDDVDENATEHLISVAENAVEDYITQTGVGL